MNKSFGKKKLLPGKDVIQHFVDMFQKEFYVDQEDDQQVILLEEEQGEELSNHR